MKPIYTACRHCNGTGREIDHQKTGKELRRLREKANISLRGLAKALGVSSAFLSDIELGHRNWTEEKVEKFLKAIKEKG